MRGLREHPGARPALRIGALFVGDRSHEFDAFARGEVPTHRLLGVAELARRGHDIHFVRRRRSATRVIPYSVRWRLYQACWVFRRQRAIDVFIATHEAAALPALVLRRIGLLRRPVLVMTVAATGDRYRSGKWGGVKRWALRGADVLTVFSSAQRALLADMLGVPEERVQFLPLGVDVDFSQPLVSHGVAQQVPTRARTIPH